MRAERDTRIARLLYYGLLVLAVVSIVGTGVLSVIALRELAESVRRVVHTEAMIGAVSDAVAAFGSAEAAHREYLLLADPSLSASYREAAAEVELRLLAVDKLVDDGAQRERFDVMASAMRDRLAAADDVVRLRDELGLVEAIAGERGGRGKPASELARRLARELQREELDMLERRELTLQQRLSLTQRAIIFAVAFAILAGSAGLWMLRRSRSASERERLAEIEAEQARRASAEKSAFLASMSHEIRTPMNAIFGFSQLLRERVRGEQEQQYLRAIDSSGRALLALINDILDLSKIEAGKLELNEEPTDVRELTDASLAVFAQMAADKRLTLRASVAPHVPAAVVLDGVRLRQILFNLVGNAVKYTEQGSVVVRVDGIANDDGRCTLRFDVEDTGIGIAADHLDRIFEPFVQAGDAHPERPPGTGLGLSITRRIAELMRGEVSVRSTLGQGSCFTVVLPDVPVAAAMPTPAEHGVRADLNRLPPSNILVVDDIALNRDLLAAIFADTHHDVLLASNGQEAIELVRAHRPDVVLMDIRMPGLDGRTVGRTLREDRSLDEVKLIAVTASSLIGDELSLRQEFDGYVRKPFTFDELHAELSRVLPGTTTHSAAVVAPGREVDADAADVDPVGPVQNDAVARELEHLLRTRWPQLRDTLAMREVGQFAREVAALGRRARSASLKSYGRRLGSAVDRFDVTTVDSMLHEFPRHVTEAVVPRQQAS